MNYHRRRRDLERMEHQLGDIEGRKANYSTTSDARIFRRFIREVMSVGEQLMGGGLLITE
jgi:hypothetical protein